MVQRTARGLRAITLGGGGPAAGPHIGVLQRCEELGIEFDVWGLSCIGAWVGVTYNQFSGKPVTDGMTPAWRTYQLFRDHIFRDDASYAAFPANRPFAPDYAGFARAWLEHAFDASKLEQYFLPAAAWAGAIDSTIERMSKPGWWFSPAQQGEWFFNDVAAVHPVTRFLASLLWLSRINGIVKLYDPQSGPSANLEFRVLEQDGVPTLYHNAWNLTTGKIELFSNRGDYRRIDGATLCACSALPYIEQTVDVRRGDSTHAYSEGALVDTVSFKDLMKNHGEDLAEIWVVRIVDLTQVRKPQTLTDSLSNLCQQFAAEVGDSDIKLFRHHMRKRRSPKPRVVELDTNRRLNFSWTHRNLEAGRRFGYCAVERILRRHPELLRHGRNSAPFRPRYMPDALLPG